MAKTITPLDCHALINSLYKEITGMEPEIKAVNSSTFVSLGQEILTNSDENILNALSMIIGRTFVASRPYTSKFSMLEETDTALYKNRVRKISYYSRYALASGDWNTQLYTNLADTFDNGENGVDAVTGDPVSTKSMWVQNTPKVLQRVFEGIDTWQDSTTVYRDQLKIAFTDEETFGSFVAGILTEKSNDIELQRETFRRMTLLNQIGAVYTVASTYPSMAVNLTTAYNTKFGTNYTSEQLRSTYLRSFVEFMVSYIKIVSRKMEYRTTNFHIPYTKEFDSVEHNILRHTPKEDQRLLLYTPLLAESESMVMSEVFNDRYLKLENYEPVDYWQNFNEPSKVKVTPAIPGSDTYEGTQVIGETVTIPYVVGCLFDKDSILVNNYLEDSLATPVEARKRYYNIWWTFARNAINDLSENFVLFYMDDSGVTPTPTSKFTLSKDTVAITNENDDQNPVTVTVTASETDLANISVASTDDTIIVDYSSGDITISYYDETATEDPFTALVVVMLYDSDTGEIIETKNITVNYSYVAPEG